MTKLYDFQEEAVAWSEYFDGRVLLALEPGLGKTLVSLEWARRYLKQGPVVVVCPATVKYHWYREARQHLKWRGLILESFTVPTEIPDAPLYIINYDILSPRQEGKRKTLGPQRSWVGLLRRKKPQLVIVDEGHYVRDPSSKRSRGVRRLCRGVPHVIIPTGTPLVNKPIELYPSLHLLLPEVYDSRWAFATEFCNPRRTPWGWKFDGADNLDVLHARLKKQCMVRMRKADVLKELPAKTYHIVPLPIERPEEYRKARDDFMGWLRSTHGDTSRVRRAKRLARYNGLKQLVGDLKLKAVKQWLADYLEEAEGKMITFGVHRKAVGEVHQHFPGSVMVNGSVTGHARQLAIDTFTRKESCRLFVGNVQAAGTGWPGQAASAVSFFELPWTPGEVTQAADRPHRIGQKGAIDVFFLLAAGTIEEDLCQLLQRKQQVLDQTLDGKHVEESLNLYDLLEKRLLRKGK